MGIIAEWTCLLAALGALTITEEADRYVAVEWLMLAGLAGLAASFAVRWARTGHPIRRTGLDGPWALFLVSAAIAAWISYNYGEAWLKFARILAAAVLYYALADSDERTLRGVAAGFVLAAAGLALYWPTQHDFAAEPGKLAIITTIGQWINAHVPRLPGPSIQWNVAGGLLVLALPFAAAWAGWGWQRRQRGAAALFGVLGLVLLGGLFLTSNRSGWLAVLVAIGLVGLVGVQRRWFRQGRRMALFWGVVVALAGGLGITTLLTGTLDTLVGMVPDPTGSVQSRLQLWDQGWGLVRDYAFTGAGLETFWMVHATYGILIHTPYLAHVHNTFLEVWIEQGALGALALVWGGVAILMGAWRALHSDRLPLLGWAGLVALAMMVVHGTFGVDMYGTRTLPLAGLAVGYAWYAVRSAPVVTGSLTPATRWALVATGGVAVLMVALVFHRGLLAAWHANAGALNQTQVELAAYDPAHFDNPTLDQVRQRADLSAAGGEFAQALAWDASNLTARQRLGTIALSRGEYEPGLAHLQAAWDAGHRDDRTRLLLGDALVATGRIEEAAGLVRGLSWAKMRLLGQAWYRYWVNKDYRRAADAWATVLLLDPTNQEVVYWRAEAEKRVR